MFKKFIYLICLTLLTNCSAPGTALLGPIFTGVKTGSVYQTSISYGGNKMVNKIIKFEKNENVKKSFDKGLDKTSGYQEPIILSTYVVNNIEISEVFEPEPLP